MTAELGGAELLLEDFAGVLTIVAPDFGIGEPGFDLLVDVGVEGLADAGAAGPVLGLADLFGGGQIGVVALDNADEDGFGGGLLAGFVAGGAVWPVTT